MANPYLSPATGPAPGYYLVPVVCPSCGGTGHEDGDDEGMAVGETCSYCNGHGEVDVERRSPYAKRARSEEEAE